MANMRQDPRTHPPTAQVGTPAPKVTSTRIHSSPEDEEWMELARSAFYDSTTYVDTNYRKAWEDSIRAFNNQHPTDSKYNQPAYEKRSRVYRPKTRAVIRKNEAAAAAAFFSNLDVVTVSAQDQTSKSEVANAEVMKQILQYRLTKSIPWYQIVLGGLQDAQTVGVVCAHIHWEYERDEDEPEPEEEAPQVEQNEEYPDQEALPRHSLMATQQGQLQGPGEMPQPAMGQPPQPGMPQQPGQPQQPPQATQQPVDPAIKKDKPTVDLLPVENLRISPGASWIDPVGTSPYIIELRPMFVLDIKQKMEKGEWRKLDDAVIGNATELRVDTTRAARNKDRDDPLGADISAIDDYTIAWVQRHIHRRDGTDWEFYTMGDLELLTDPIPLEEVVFTGKRPYVIGQCIIETHKLYSSSVPMLGKGLQDETNEIANQRIDNVKFVLNKKWFVKRGREADVAGLIRNVPGGVVMLDDPEKDVREINWPDVTASAFQEQQGISMEMDELLGNFNPASLMAQGAMNSPAKNMAMLSNSQGTLVEYLIRTYVETFVQPVLRHIVQLEQEYETDQVILKLATKNANVVQKYGVNPVTDGLLKAELNLTVNVGMGATDPMQKLQKFLAAMNTYVGMLTKPTPGINMPEVGKEIFGLLGYSDGTRFFNSDNPQVNVLQQQLQQAMQMINQLQTQIKEKQTGHVVKLQTAREKNQVDIAKAKLHEENENKRSLATHFRALTEASNTKQHDRVTQELQRDHDKHMAEQQREHDMRMAERKTAGAKQ